MQSLRATALAACLTLSAAAPGWASDAYVIHLTPQDKRATLALQKDPAIAALLAFPLPGLGHIYAGNWQRGLAFTGGALVLLVGAIIVNSIASQTTPVNNDPNGVAPILTLLVLGAFEAVNVRDAFYTTIAINDNLEETARGIALPKGPEF
ncbi:MAG: hypothetical protein H7338_13560 [Candidatus Sericytochromatia bacterium]|nr:hypothetical protein [Candidatus Sericytochromatia bacterium]